MADFNALASAIATRFSAANITPPSGERDIVLSTHQLPPTVAQEPTVLVFPPDPDSVEFTYMGGTRTFAVIFPVRFYLWNLRDNKRNAELVLKWLGSLYQQLDGEVHLGLSSYVANSEVATIGAGRMTYAGVEYEGIQIDVQVNVWEALTVSN